MEALASLRTRCQQLVDLVKGLSSFKTLSLEEVQSAVSRIPILHGECVTLVKELESCFRVPKPFYPSRPSHSVSTVNDFMTNLERLFVQEWKASR
jgi:hypothetical protein